jgi:pfkB family carbohydrate kinase
VSRGASAPPDGPERRAEAEHRHLIIGHVCWDELADGRAVLGGTAYYAAVQAGFLGCRVTVETACTQPTLDTFRLVVGPQVSVRSSDSDVDTRYAFESDVRDGPSRLVSRAATITSIDQTDHVDSAHIAPIAGEISTELIRSVRDRVGFLGVTPQGLMRVFSSGVLRRDAIQQVPVLALADAVVVNEAEYHLLLQSQPEVITESTADLFVTHGARGASLLRRGHEVARCAPPRAETDPRSRTIGAGDVFASTVFVGLARGAAATTVLEEAVHAASAFVSRPPEMTMTGWVAGVEKT